MKKLILLGFVIATFMAHAQAQLCVGGSATITAATPGTLTGQNYSIQPGAVSSPSPQFIVSPTATTTYTLFTTGTNSANVQATTTVVTTVSVFAQPTISPTYTNSTCSSTVEGFNFHLTFLPSSSSPTYNIAWAAIPPLTIPSIPACITNAPTQYSCVGSMGSGPYGATITSAGGCTVAVAFTINPQPTPANFTLIPTYSTYTINCINPTITVNANNANNTYTWNSASTGTVNSSSLSLTSGQQGTLSVIGTNTQSGCTLTKTVAVVVNTTVPNSAITPISQNITCTQTAAQTITLTANSPIVNITHVVTPPQNYPPFVANTATAPYSPPSLPGTYTYCLVDNINGCSNCKNFTITTSTGIPTLGIVSPQNYTLGCNSKSLCTVNVYTAITAPFLGQSVFYYWLPPGYTPTTLPSNQVSSTVVTTPGTWTVVVVDQTNQCQTRVPFSVVQDIQGPQIDSVSALTKTLSCYTPSVNLTVFTEDTVNTSYNWSFPFGAGNLASKTVSATVISTAAPTTTFVANYTITLTDNNNTCISQSVVPVYQNVARPTISISASTGTFTCNNPTITLTNQSNSGITSPAFPHPLGVQGYIWMGPSPQPTIYLSSTYIGEQVGTYTLIGKDLNNGCTNSGTIALFEGRIYPKLTFSETTVPQIDCGAKGYTLRVIPSPSIANATYTWTPPAGALSGTTNIQTFTAAVKGNYSVTVTDAGNGCATDTVIFVDQGKLTGAIAVDKDFGYAPLDVNFINNSFSANNQTNSITTVWSFGNGTSLTTTDVSVPAKTTFKFPGTYTVWAFITKNPCLDTVIKVITVEAPSRLEVPNIFTPNGDNANDVFYLHTTNLTNISMKIFDRWGHLVYELESGTGNVLWDGKNQYGKECSEGTYYYTLKATGSDGNNYEQKGNISLVR